MGFKDWLNEEVDVASALKEKAEKGLNIKTKFGTFKFDKMDKKKYVFVLDGDDKDISVVVAEKPNEKYLDLTISVFKKDSLVGKRKSAPDDDSETQYLKTDITRKAAKDIKKAVEEILGSLNEDELITLDEDFGATALAAALIPLVIGSIPVLNKAAHEYNWFGIANEKESKIKTIDDIKEKIQKFSLKQIQEILKDEKKADAIVDELLDTIKKESPRFIVNPRTKAEIYDQVLFYLRRSAEAKSKEPVAKGMTPVKDAAKDALARSSGYKKGGVWFGTQN